MMPAMKGTLGKTAASPRTDLLGERIENIWHEPTGRPHYTKRIVLFR